MISSSPARCEQLQRLGADETIDYTAQPQWNEAVRKLTGGVGVDLTVEVGGSKTIDRALASTRSGGRLAAVGLLTGRPSAAAVGSASGVDINAIRVGSRQDFEAMNRALSFHNLRPIIDTRYRFEHLPDALRYRESGRHLGKIVIGFG